MSTSRTHRGSAPPFDLILITDPQLQDPVRFVERALVDAPPHRVAVQLRAKQWTSAERTAAAIAIRTITRATTSALIVNGDLDACIDADADGVQLPSHMPDVAAVRQRLGPGRWIGASCHDASELQRATTGGVDFAVLSPWGAVPDKGDALGAQTFGELCAATTLPVYALGGIDVTAIPQAVAAGARGVAVIRAAHVALAPHVWVRDALLAMDRARAAFPIV